MFSSILLLTSLLAPSMAQIFRLPEREACENSKHSWVLWAIINLLLARSHPQDEVQQELPFLLAGCWKEQEVGLGGAIFFTSKLILIFDHGKILRSKS